MGENRIIGIDFGTSTSVLRVKSYNEEGESVGQKLFAQAVTFNNGSSMVPSVIRSLNGVNTYGYDAEIPTRHSTVFRNFKLGLQSEDKKQKEVSKQKVQEFFEFLFSEYEHQRDCGHFGDVDVETKTLVSYPVKWDSEIRNFMLEVAQKAGFENVSGMDEAEAAIRAVSIQCKDSLLKGGWFLEEEPVNVLLVDMGAGTTDVVVCKYTAGEKSTNEILTTWPKGGEVLVGGQEVDTLLKDYVISKFPQEIQEQVASKITIDQVKAWKENNVSPALKENREVNEFSEADNVAYWLDIDLEEFCLNREVFESIFAEYITGFVQLVGGAIMDSGLTPEEIDVVILTGGNSLWYFVEEILSGKNKAFGDLNLKKIVDDNSRILSVALPQETVALGLVYSKLSGDLTFDRAEHLWKTYRETGSIEALKDAAQMEYPEALNELAFHLNAGDILPANQTEATALYEKAAQLGNASAMYNLGCRYFQRKDYFRAIEYFQQAAAAGMPEAYNNLAVIHHYGLGVPADDNKAAELFKTAYDNGFVSAKKHYEQLFNSSNSAQQFNQNQTDDLVEYAKSINTAVSPNFYFGIKAIPPQKLSRFMMTFYNVNFDSEKVICYFDDTFFGGGGNGFILTDKNLYLRSFLVSGQVVEVARITDINRSSNGYLSARLTDGSAVVIPCGRFQIQLELFFKKMLDVINNK